DYTAIVAKALTLLPPDTVIARLTGDGAPDALLAPDWSRKKTAVVNDVDKILFSNDLYQGKYYHKTEDDYVC
ncbi:MAG: TIGR01212 family radical SAM protein, partial [Clostridia bacterium]|nr:TIGR01212 family radical SAM protein [Clostridia bacterium]